jgi:4-hydroxybenzoate polyprenyltransferase
MSSATVSRARLYLGLGRVSNLPTVWTNTMAGAVLAGGTLEPIRLALLATSLSLFYVGGMFLNDAFDREIDAIERPERPIPSGRISAREVFTTGFGMMAVGFLGLLAAASLGGASTAATACAGIVLFGAIVLYDAWHKKNTLAPVVMGLCRAAVYVSAGLAAGGSITRSLALGALVLLAYVVGLTFVARQENRKSYRAGLTLAMVFAPVALVLVAPEPPTPLATGALLVFVAWATVAILPLFSRGPVNVPRSVIRLIAGISLVDGLAVVVFGAPALGLVCAASFGATLGLQRWVRGT